MDEPQGMPHPPEDAIAGYRVLRRIAQGARTSVLLAHGGDPPATVVLKVASPDDPGAFREAAALDLGTGEHVVGLLDAHADDGRVVLVLPRLPGGDLARLLAARADLAGGEAVTILAPIADTVRRLHRTGVAHGALTAAAVLFDEEGAPTLTGFGAAVVFPSEAPEVELERVPEVGADRAALRGIASIVLDRVGGERRGAAQRLLGRLRAASGAEAVDVIADGIFGVAAALPVRSEDAGPAGGRAGSATERQVPVSEAIDQETATAPGLRARLAAVLDRSPTAELRGLLARRWAALPPGRRRMALAAGAGALALGVAFAAIPSGGAPRSVSASSSLPRTAPGTPRASDPPPSAAVSDREGAVRGDDPVAAAAALLIARAACRRELSILCLDDVDQDGSAAAQTDRDAVRVAQAGGELADDPLAVTGDPAPRLVERTGGSALIGLEGGASVLLVLGESGWRIRDALPAPARTTPPPGG